MMKSVLQAATIGLTCLGATAALAQSGMETSSQMRGQGMQRHGMQGQHGTQGHHGMMGQQGMMGHHGMQMHHGMQGHHGGMRPRGKKGPHGRHAAEGPTLMLEIEGKGREMKFVCHASMAECLEAFDRVQAARGDREPRRDDQDN